jgi:hypothetical protein
VPELTDHELETAKMYQDSFKHLTTFSAGAILLSSSVAAAFFKNPTNLWALLYLSLGCFLVGAALATAGLYITVNHLDNAFRVDIIEAEPGRRQRQRSILFRSSSFVTYMGVASFGVFALMNFN